LSRSNFVQNEVEGVGSTHIFVEATAGTVSFVECKFDTPVGDAIAIERNGVAQASVIKSALSYVPDLPNPFGEEGVHEFELELSQDEQVIFTFAFAFLVLAIVALVGVGLKLME
jgi:hypothetical protein